MSTFQNSASDSGSLLSSLIPSLYPHHTKDNGIFRQIQCFPYSLRHPPPHTGMPEYYYTASRGSPYKFPAHNIVNNFPHQSCRSIPGKFYLPSNPKNYILHISHYIPRHTGFLFHCCRTCSSRCFLSQPFRRHISHTFLQNIPHHR